MLLLLVLLLLSLLALLFFLRWQGLLRWPLGIVRQIAFRIAFMHMAMRPMQADSPTPETMHVAVDNWVIPFRIGNWNNPKRPVVLFIGGNNGTLGSHYAAMVSVCAQLDCNFVTYDHPGYGDTRRLPGAQWPTEETAYAAGEAVAEAACKAFQINTRNIIVWGRSAGTGVASWLCARHQFRGLVMMAGYQDLISIVLDWGWLRWLRVEAMPSWRHVAELDCPALFIHGTADEVIAAGHSHALIEFAARGRSGAVQLELIKGAGHNAVLRHPASIAAVRAFIGTSVLGMKMVQ